MRLINYTIKKNGDKRSPQIPLSRTKKWIFSILCILVVFTIAAGIVITSYPNTLIHYVIEPKLKQLVTDRLGRRYSLQMTSITLSKNKDSLILTGVRITDNGKTDDGSSDTSSENFGITTPLDRLTTDTVMIAGLDYWKLVFQKGLFAGTITIRSPKIYLRPGTLPKFAENTDLLPSFLPTVSSKIIRVENAEVFLTEGTPSSGTGVFVKKASLEFKNFFLDEPTYKKTVSTFFCKSATFHAENISHVDSLGVTDIRVETVDGDLIDSSMNVNVIESTKPIEEVRRVTITQIEFTGLDWYTALAGHGLHGRNVTISDPHVYLQDVADIHPSSSLHYAASDLIPLPSLLPDIALDNVEVRNAEVYALLPECNKVSSLKRIRMSLEKFKLDPSTPFTNISTFFSNSVRYGVHGESDITTSLGTLHMSEISGTEKMLTVSHIRLDPSLKGLKLVKLQSVEIGGLDIWKLLMRQGIFSATVNIREPNIYLEDNFIHPITSIDSMLTSDPLMLIRGVKQYPLPLLLPVAGFGRITVSGGSVHGIHFLDDPNNLHGAGDSLSDVNLTLTNFNLDQHTWTHNRGMLFSDAGTFSIGRITQLTPGAIYSYSTGIIRGDLRKHTLIIDSVAVHPLISEDSFGVAFKYRTERVDFFAPKVEIAGLDYHRLFLGSGLYADSILLRDSRANIYGDRRRPEEVRTKRERYPSEIFQQIIVPVGINRVVVRDGDVRFRESWPDTTTPGTITIDHINARTGLITNDRHIANDLTLTLIEGDMRIMNAGLVQFSIDYELLNPHFTLDCRGKVGNMDASLFNEYLAETEPFTVTGNIRSADFDFHIKDSSMTGTLTPQYDKLHVKFFRWDKFPPGFVSFFANTFFMRSHNIPELDSPLYVSTILSTIDRSGNVFWGLWLPIRNAIGGIVRIPNWVW
jgi:hypothetical protein